LGICTTGDSSFGDLYNWGFRKKSFGDFHLGIKKKTIGDFKITDIWGWKNTFGDIHLGMKKKHLGMQKNTIGDLKNKLKTCSVVLLCRIFSPVD
jgi:hypothetical protein